MYFKEGKPTGSLDEFLNHEVVLNIRATGIVIEARGFLRQLKNAVSVDDYYIQATDSLDCSIHFCVRNVTIEQTIDEIGYHAPVLKVTPDYIGE